MSKITAVPESTKDWEGPKFTAKVTYNFTSKATGEPCVKTYENVTKEQLKQYISIYSNFTNSKAINVEVVK